MPLNETQFRVARALNKKQQERMWSLADRPGTSFDDPEYAKTAKNFRDTSDMIREYEAANRKVDDAGKLTAEPTTHLPPTVEAVPPSPEAKGAAADAMAPPAKRGNPAGYNYFFEPSIAEVQTLLRKSPEVALKAGLDPAWLTGISSPQKTEDVTDPTSGMKVGQNQVAARTHLDDLTTERSAYKDVANYLWNQRSEEAKKQGIELQRYRDIPLKGHIPDFLAGGAIYNIERRLTPGVLGVADAATLGLASPAGDYLTEKIGDAASALGVDIGPQPTAEDVRNRSPFSYMVGNLYGYGLPRNPTNIIQQELYGEGLKQASKLFKPGVGTKAVVSGLAGGGANAVEGAVGDFGRELGEGKSVGEAAGTALSGAPLNSLMGLALGGGADLGGRLADAGRKNIRTQDHLMMPLKALREGGGDTHMLWGVTAPKEVRGHIDNALEDGGVGSPAARAADVVAPRIQESLERQDIEAGNTIGAQMEEYYAHPKYGQTRVSSKPLVQALVDLVSEGRFTAPVTGAPTHMDHDAIRTIQNEVVRHKWAEPVYATRQAAAEHAAEVDGIVVDLDTAHDIFGNIPDGVGSQDVAVIVPKHMTAKELTRFEDKVYGKLKPNEHGSTVESPVYKRLDIAAKEVRDKFPYYIDDQDRLIDPPEGPSGPPSAPPPSESPVSLRPSEYDEVPSSSAADTIERQSEGEVKIGSEDFIPSAEELNSDDFLTRSGIELNSADFDPATAAEPAGRPTPRLRDLRRRAVPEGPQKSHYDNHNDYLMARAKWRFQKGKATTADKKRFEKAADAIPPTQRMPGSEKMDAAAPATQRSIAPEDATPLSLLAGNNLAMDVPDRPFETGARDYPDESLPGPMAKDWADSNKETENWFEDIVAPGRDPRSDEAKRMGDLTAQQQAFEEVNAKIADVEGRFGEFTEENRLKSILSMLSEKLGREVTKEDLIRAGLITGGAVAALSDDEGIQEAGAMAVAGGSGFKKGGPSQLERKLANGETVKGFSALRGQQHDLKSGIETAKRRVGASNEKTIKDRVMEYNLQDNIDFDRELLKEAQKLGLDKELRTAAATRVYPKLKRQAWGGSNKGSLEGLASFLGLRADKLLELLSGAPRNPFDRSPSLLIRDNLREQFNLSGGRTGARYGDNLRKKLFKEEDDNGAR